MATNLVPASSSWTTANMKPAAGDDGDETWGQNVAENTGFNWLGCTNKPSVSYGTKDIAYINGTTTTDIDFGVDKTDGVADFVGTDYVVMLFPLAQPPAPIAEYQAYVTNRATGTCTITTKKSGAGTGSTSYMWIAFGN